MHKTQEMKLDWKSNFQPSEEYVHYKIIWGNCVLTWFYFSLALSLKSNTKQNKTPKLWTKEKDRENRQYISHKPGECETSSRRIRTLRKEEISNRPLKQTWCTPHRVELKTPGPWALGGFLKEECEGHPPSSPSIPQTGEINQQCEWPECNIPKKDSWE